MRLEARSAGSGTTAQNLFVTHDMDGEEIAPVQITSPGMHPRWAKAIADAVNAAHDKASDGAYALVAWAPGDVLALANISEQEAEDFLDRNAKHLQDRLIELGWGVMESLLSADGIKITKVEE